MSDGNPIAPDGDGDSSKKSNSSNRIFSELFDFIIEEPPVSFGEYDTNRKLADKENEAFGTQEYQENTFDNLFNKRYTQNTQLRRHLARWAAYVVSIWMLFVLLILVLNEKWLICLSDSVLITLLGTTTANVLGLVAIVLYDLFNRKSEKRP